MLRSLVVVLLASSVCLTKSIFALPIGFSHHQNGISYDELVSSHYRVYYDQRMQDEGRYILSSLELAKPHLQNWLGVARDKPLPVVVSSISSNASFANFITDVVELQTQGGADRTLFWHELTHATMYLHFYNFLGPAGSLIHLPWVPAWFIEGLAEALTASTGSDIQIGMERYHALSGNWPSYDRLHDLYGKSDFALEGYATSGAFVFWLLTKLKEGELPLLLDRIRRYSLPTYYLWSFSPLSPFMPFDDAILEFLGERPRKLYEEYKKERRLFWQKEKQGVWLETASQLPSPVEEELATGIKKYLVEDDLKLLARESESRKGEKFTEVFLEENPSPVFSFTGELIDWRLVGKFLVWRQDNFADAKLCHIEVAKLQTWGQERISCPVALSGLARPRILGASHPQGEKSGPKLWYLEENPTTFFEHYTLKMLDPETNQITTLEENAADLRSLTTSQGQNYAIAIFADRRAIQELAQDGSCKRELVFASLPLRIRDQKDGTLLVTNLEGSKRQRHKFYLQNQSWQACSKPEQSTSPMFVSVNSTDSLSLSEALAKSRAKAEGAYPMLSKAEPEAVHNSPANYRLRPILAFPWIGAEDALGNQYGVISIPLMDEMQNETLRASFLFGSASRYPASQIDLVSTRFFPTLTVSAFRRQLFNGVVVNSEDRLDWSYLDEKGGEVSASYLWQFGDVGVDFVLGLKASHLSPFLGPDLKNGVGNLREGYATSKYTYNFGMNTLSLSLLARGTHELMQDNFHYAYVQSKAYLARTFKSLANFKMGLGLEAGHFRGKQDKSPNLKENYQALKTFLPGSGGGYNQNSFRLAGDGGLFRSRFGDSQARVKLDGSYPIVEDLERQIWLLYLKSLVFSFFYNYGGAWYQGQERFNSRFIAAQGYNLDLFLGNKGVGFNSGVGAGQVFGRDFALYFNFGFDAIF